MEITITVPDELATKAESNGLTPKVYIEKLLGRLAAVSTDPLRERAQLQDELRADWEDFRATGLHLDDDEVDAWLAGLEEGRFVAPPALHR